MFFFPFHLFDQLDALLESLPGIGNVTVEFDANDELACSGGRWTVSYDTQAGDLQMADISTHNLTGTNVSVNVTEVSGPTCYYGRVCMTFCV